MGRGKWVLLLGFIELGEAQSWWYRNLLRFFFVSYLFPVLSSPLMSIPVLMELFGINMTHLPPLVFVFVPSQPHLLYRILSLSLVCSFSCEAINFVCCTLAVIR